MSISARKFLDRLAERGLLEDQVVQQVRTHIEQSLFEVPADAVAKMLVDKGHLTSFQANKLVAEVTAEVEAEESAPAPKKAAPASSGPKAPVKPFPKPEPVSVGHQSDDLG